MQSLAFKYFHEVAQRGSLSAASESLHVAVSAISRQIHQLEQRVGCALFDRSARGMRLTTAGELLLKHVRRINLETEATFQAIAGLHNAEKSPIRLACTQGVAQEMVPSVMAEFCALQPETRFAIFVSSAKVATQRVEMGEADIAITFSTTPSETIAVRYSCGAPALAVMTMGHPLAKRKKLSLTEVQQYPLALTDQATSTFKLYQMACNMTGKWCEPALYSNHSEALHSYVRDSHAILFASYISVVGRLDSKELIAVPLRNPEMHARVVQVQVMKGRILPETMDLFIELVIKRIKEINTQAPQ